MAKIMYQFGWSLYTKVNGCDGKIMDFMCLTMVDPATGWFEMADLPTVLRIETEMVKLLKRG